MAGHLPPNHPLIIKAHPHNLTPPFLFGISTVFSLLRQHIKCMWTHLYCVTVISVVCKYNMVETTDTVTTHSSPSGACSLMKEENGKRGHPNWNVTCYEWKTNEQKPKQGVLTLEMSMWLTVRLGDVRGWQWHLDSDCRVDRNLPVLHAERLYIMAWEQQTREQPHMGKSQNGTGIKGDRRNKQGVLWPLPFIPWNCTEVKGEALAYLKWQSDGI